MTPRSIAGLATVIVLLIAPASSEATLAFTRNPLSPTVFAANDNGSAARKLGSGSNPRVSPDGQMVVFYRFGKGKQPSELMVATATGGTPKKLASGWRDPFVFAWSSDSTTIAVLLGPEVGKQRLTTIDIATGAQHTIARGYFSGVSFAPQGSEQLVYARATSESFPPRSDIYGIDLLPLGAIGIAAVSPHRLTSDHRSSSPLWGPDGQIVFVKHLGEKSRKYGPKNELFLMNPNGSKVERLTHTKVDPLLSGLSPTEWSANGSRLLTEFGGQDTTYAVTVNPKTGAERTLTKEREVGFVGTALSKDGTTVLGSLGGFEPGPGHRVISIPYAGGKPKVLANNASEPDWSR
ncbi:MAG: Dipeptidyl peptidase N-terminal region [Solirubrobacterales bacterium]|nr:Dipeptidyl peptidase N-terminal region [Solirubrobacterales bacterium]